MGRTSVTIDWRPERLNVKNLTVFVGRSLDFLPYLLIAAAVVGVAAGETDGPVVGWLLVVSVVVAGFIATYDLRFRD